MKKIQFANYCGYDVIVEKIYATKREGTLADITFQDDGRKETVPYSTLEIVD